MERGKGSQSGHRTTPRSNSVVNPAEQQQSYTSPENTRGREYYLPVANITRVMRRVIPPNAKIADDAKETVQQCVTEYINMVTSEANDRCHGEERRTITADDILWAMGRLGFDNYVGHLSLFLDRYRNLQREWNEGSAEPLRRRAADFERLPPPTYGLLPAFPPGDVFGRSRADAMAGMNTGYYPDNAGAGSSSSASQDGGPSFGPYAQFKLDNPAEQQQQQQSYTSPENTRHREYYVPVANITRVMRRVLPPNAKIADDAKETVQQCVTEYINMVTSEANDRCHGEERRTITADDILWAMGRLGFDNYVGHLSLFLDRYRNLQREWNEESAEPLRRRAADFERLPPPTYGLQPAFPPGDVFGRSSADAMAGMNMGCYPNNAGASSSSSSARQDGGPSFGPYSQFKR